MTRRTPVRTVSVDADVSLDEFDDSDIAEYLRGRGYFVSAIAAVFHDQDGESPNILDPDELNHIDHLAICGQIGPAKQEAIALIEKAIGRTLQ